MSAATARRSCSFRRLCSVSSFPLGNYHFPVVIIILQHAADSISNTSHFHLQPAGCPRFPAVPSTPPTPIAWCRGQRDRPLSTGWREREKQQKGDEAGKDGEGGLGTTMEDGCPLDQHPPTYTHAHTLSLLPRLSKGRMACER